MKCINIQNNDCYCIRGLLCSFPLPLLIFIYKYSMIGKLTYKYEPFLHEIIARSVDLLFITVAEMFSSKRWDKTQIAWIINCLVECLCYIFTSSAQWIIKWKLLILYILYQWCESFNIHVWIKWTQAKRKLLGECNKSKTSKDESKARIKKKRYEK